MIMEKDKNAIHTYLLTRCLGRRFAVKARILADHFGVTLREINEVVRQLRKDGRLIGSAKEPPFGYYVPADDREREEYLKCFKGELFDMLQTFRAQRRARREFLDKQSQQCLFPDDGSRQAVLAGI